MEEEVISEVYEKTFLSRENIKHDNEHIMQRNKENGNAQTR